MNKPIYQWSDNSPIFRERDDTTISGRVDSLEEINNKLKAQAKDLETHTKELEKQDSKVEKVNNMMLVVVIILVIMVANILITTTIWTIELFIDGEKKTYNFSISEESMSKYIENNKQKQIPKPTQ